MKVDNGGMNRISKKRVARTQRSEKELRLSDRRKLGGWSGRDEATLSEMTRILAKTCTSLKDVPDVRTELVDGLKKEINARLDKELGGYHIETDKAVKHVAQVLGYDVGPSEIAEKIKRKVNIKLSVHYGCHFLRPFNEKQIDDPDKPSILEDYIEALGAESVDHPRKYACCGAGGGVLSGHADASMKMLAEKLQAVQDSGADAILNICPFCHLQFDAGQQNLNKNHGTNFNIPSINIAQLTAFCFGQDDVGLKYNITAPDFKLEAAPLE